MFRFQRQGGMLGSVTLTLLILVVAGPAFGGIITYGPTLHDNGGAGYGAGTVGTYTDPQFDDLGGLLTLTKVTLTVTIDGDGGAHAWDNEGGTATTITLGIGSEVRVKGPVPPGSQLVVNPDAFTTVTGPITADTDGAPDFIGTDSLSIIGTSVTDTRSSFKTGVSDLVPYIGVGLATFSFDGGTSTSGTSALPGPAANLVTFGTTNFRFTTTLQYEYIPEPSSIALAALGGMGSLAIAIRRRR